jgi:hypothetical protein
MLLGWKKRNILARADFDGLVGSLLLSQHRRIAEARFVSAQDIADGTLPVDAGHILIDLPWKEAAYEVWDHRARREVPANMVLDSGLPSTSRVIWEHFGGQEAFPQISEGLIAAVDKFASAGYSRNDIESPEGWELLSFLLDTQTGLLRLQEFRLSGARLFAELLAFLPGRTADEVLVHPDVAERVALYREEAPLCAEQLRRCSQLQGKFVLLDLRSEPELHAGNRYRIYALYPEASLSLQLTWGFLRETVILSMGRSIVDRTSTVDVGALMRQFGGGGHAGAGKCQVPVAKLEETLAAIRAAVG